MTDKITRISLWSSPRNISTALMYSFAQRQDTKVLDEPLYAHYLSNTPAKTYHPAAEEVLRTMENDGQKVVEMMLGNAEKPVLFYKNMTYKVIEVLFLEKFVFFKPQKGTKDELPMAILSKERKDFFSKDKEWLKVSNLYVLIWLIWFH